MWFLVQRYGVVKQRLSDLDDVHGFTGRVGQSLDPTTIMEAAVVKTATLLRAESASLVVFDLNRAAGDPLDRGRSACSFRSRPTMSSGPTTSESDEAALVDRGVFASSDSTAARRRTNCSCRRSRTAPSRSACSWLPAVRVLRTDSGPTTWCASRTYGTAVVESRQGSCCTSASNVRRGTSPDRAPEPIRVRTAGRADGQGTRAAPASDS